jgi:hypothetical protein
MDNDGRQLTDWELAIEYGRHVFGVLPDGTVTGVLAHKGQFWKSYIQDSDRYPRWEREYDHTPLEHALEGFVRDEEMWVKECSYNGTYYQMTPIESASLSGWRFEHRRKLGFKKAVLRGDITLPAPAVFNSYGDCFIEVGHQDEIHDLFWSYVDANWEKRHDHHTGVEA